VGYNYGGEFRRIDLFYLCVNNNHLKSSLCRLHGLGISFSDTFCVIYIVSEIDFQIRLQRLLLLYPLLVE